MSEPFKTAALMKDLMAKYYNRGEECRREGIPVVWVTAVFPGLAGYERGCQLLSSVEG